MSCRVMMRAPRWVSKQSQSVRVRVRVGVRGWGVRVRAKSEGGLVRRVRRVGKE